MTLACRCRSLVLLSLLLAPLRALAAAPEPAPPPASDEAPAKPSAALPEGFFRDAQGRVMQVSFDLQQRLWLGAAYAPRRLGSGRQELTPVAFDFGYVDEEYADGGRTRHRFRVLEGEARLNPFGLDVAVLRYDLSHAFDYPLLRVTTLWAQPARHDLFLNVGFAAQALRLQIEPFGEPGNHQLTLGSVQGTLDLWQSRDLRSYLRLRAGPVAHLRLGPWHEETRASLSLPETALEGNFILGQRALQQLRFCLHGEWMRAFDLPPAPLATDLLAAAEASYEIVLLAINDQPVSLLLAARAGARDQQAAPLPGSDTAAGGRLWTWDWTLTAGLRISFFSPPVARSPRR